MEKAEAITLDEARELVGDAALWPRMRDFLWDFAPQVHESWLGGLAVRWLGSEGSAQSQDNAAAQLPNYLTASSPRVKAYILEVRRTSKGPQVSVSRTHPGLLKRLFELEVPEIFDGTVEIKSIAREAGSRTKMAVWSSDPNVDPIGSCVGPKGGRVASIVNELGGEKIDIVKYSEIPEEYIAAALSPSEVVSVTMQEDGKSCRVIVPDNQLSLAIGKEGQNARLAAKLTGFKIDIKPESEA